MPKTKQNWGRIAYGADNLVFVWLLTTLPNFKRADNDENCLEQTIKVKSTLSEQWENAEAAHRKRIQTDNEVQAQRRVQYLDSFGLHFKSQNTILRRLRAILCHPGTILGPSWAILGASWGHLSRLGGHLGRLGGILEVILAVLEAILGVLGPLGPS